MKTVNDLIRELESLKPELREKPIQVLHNNELHIPEIKTKLIDPYNVWDKSSKNVKSITLT